MIAPQVGGTTTPQLGLPLEPIQPVLPSGPNKLTRLFDAMDAVATVISDTSRAENIIRLLAATLGHTNPSSAIVNAIYTVLQRALNPKEYPTDNSARACRGVKPFLFSAWRFRLHTVSHCIPIVAANIAKVIFVSFRRAEIRVWVGSRRHTQKSEHVFDLPGGDHSNHDVNARATAWRNVADQDLHLSPPTRSKLARTLSCTNPTLVEQLHLHNGTSSRITIWTQIILLGERARILPTEDACRKWSHTGWVPETILIESLENQGLHHYATGCKTAIESSLTCHETISRPEGSQSMASSSQ